MTLKCENIPVFSEKMLPAISVNKWCSAINPTHYSHPMVSPEQTQERNRMPTTYQSAAAATPDDALRCPQTKDEKAWIPAPDNWSAYQKNNFNKPRLLHLFIQRKALNSLIWDIWFSLTNSNHSMFQLPGLLQKLLYTLAPPLPLGAVSQSYLRYCVLGLSPQFCLPNKT